MDAFGHNQPSLLVLVGALGLLGLIQTQGTKHVSSTCGESVGRAPRIATLILQIVRDVVEVERDLRASLGIVKDSKSKMWVLRALTFFLKHL